MIEWNKICIKDICTKICSGGTPKSTIREYYYNGTIPWLNTGEIHFNRIYQTKNKITELGFKNSSAKWIEANSVIIALYGETAGKVALTRIPLTTNQACCNLTLDSSIADPNFVYYSFLNSYSRLLHLKNGGAQQNISVQIIKEFDILLPPLETQKKIAAVLSSLDDKIELNTRMNKVLEEIAQVIFKRWFVEFEFPNEKGEPYRSSGGQMKESELGLIPEGWGVKKFEEILTPRKEKSSSGDIPEYSVTNTGMFPREKKFNKKLSMKANNYKLIRKGDLVFGNSRSILNWGIMKEEIGCVSSAYNVFKIDQSINPMFVESYISERMNYFSDIIDTGTTRDNQGIDRTKLMRKYLSYPQNTLLEDYFVIVNSLYKLKDDLTAEIEKVVEIRDTVLPKLMSGEIEI